jgi:hypothetical protein
MKWDAALDVFINKFHILLGTAAQGSILAYHFKTGHDIGAGIQNSLYGYYAFLGAHALTYQKYPDAPVASNVVIPSAAIPKQ